MSTTSAESLLSVRHAAPDLLVRGRQVRVGVELEQGGAGVQPSAATVSLLKPDGTAVVSAASATTTATGAYYDIPAGSLPSTLTPLGEGWQLVWVLTIAGVPQTIDREAALILRPLLPAINDTDIEDEYPDVSRDRGQLADLSGFRESAWKRIISRLYMEGHLSYLIKSGYAFRVIHIELTLALFYAWMAKNQGGRGNWLELSQLHHERYAAAWKGTNWKADFNHDGRVDDDSKRVSLSRALHQGGSPTTRHPRGM